MTFSLSDRRVLLALLLAGLLAGVLAASAIVWRLKEARERERKLAALSAQLRSAQLESESKCPELEPRAGLPTPQPLTPAANQEEATLGNPLFACGYSNFAWGKVAYGHVIDDQGRIWFYDLGATWNPVTMSRDGSAGIALRASFPNLVLQERRVPKEQLDLMTEKAEQALLGTIEQKFMAYDAGGSGCTAYLWLGEDLHSDVELGYVGDLCVTNSSPAAVELRQWLRFDLGLGRPPPGWSSRRKRAPDSAGPSGDPLSGDL